MCEVKKNYIWQVKQRNEISIQDRVNQSFAKINNNNLDEIIDFLVLNFQQSHNFKKNIKNYLIQSNAKENFYGFCLFNKRDSRIYGAILCPKQLSYYSSHLEKKVSVYNLSTWYVDPLFRGLGTKIFIEKVLQNLDHNIITSYTSNIAASKILKLFGFKNMSYFEIKFSFKQWLRHTLKARRLFSLFPRALKMVEVKNLKIDISVPSLAQSRLYKYKVGNKNLFFCILIKPTQVTLFKSIIGRVNIGEILWVSDTQFFYENISEIFFSFFLRNFILFLNININSGDYEKMPAENKQNFYISNGKKFIFKTVDDQKDFCPPIGSEKGLLS